MFSVIRKEGTSYPKKLNFGCGQDLMEDHVNLDVGFDPTFLAFVTENKPSTVLMQGDLRSPYDLPGNWFNVIYANMVMEHIHPDNIANVLYCLRMSLAPRGTLHIIVPDFEVISKDCACCADPALFREATNDILDPQYDTGERRHGHKSLWTKEIAKQRLLSEGFYNLGISNMGKNNWYLQIIAKLLY